MAVENWIAGAYTGTYNAVDVGSRDDQGFELEVRTHGEAVDKTDIYGMSLLDYVHQGMSAFLTFNSMVYKAGSKTPFYPWGNFGVVTTAAAPIARLASDVASAMVMTAVAATPAAASPATVTASKSILPPDSNLKLLYTSKVRKVPIKLALLPTLSAGTLTVWTET